MSGTTGGTDTNERAPSKEQSTERSTGWLPAELAERLRVQNEKLSEFRGRL